MKNFLSLLLLAGVALGYSTSYYGWVPSKEYVYHFESQVLTGLPQIRSQYSGLKLSSTVKIQSFPDYSLRIQFIEPKFLTINDDLSVIDGKIQVPTVSHEDIPEAIRSPLVTPFEVHFKRGLVETLFVEKDEPVVVTNLKKALLAQLQMDLSASRESSVQKLNHKVLPQVLNAQEEMRNVSFFSTMETSLHGDCETSYTLHPLPLYQARELEEQWRVHKIKVIRSMPTYTSKISEEHIMKQHREAELVCEGQQYYEVTKTKNFDNCRQRPVYTSWSGSQANCDTTKAGCEDLTTSMSSTRYIVCGTPEQFTIRKVVTKNILITNPLGWSTKEKLQTTATVKLELIKVETAGFQPLRKPTHSKELTNLFMEYPEHKIMSSKSIGHRMSKSQLNSQSIKMQSLTGFYPLHPMPEMTVGPKLLFPTSIPKPELYHQVKELMSKIVQETFESPESCSSSSDVAGYIISVAKALRPLSLDELKEAQTEVMNYMETRNKDSLTVAKYLFYDVLSMVSTNPSVVLVKELIESEEIPRVYAAQILQSTLKNVKTPTQELFNEIFSLVKSVKSKSNQLFSVSAVTLSDLLHRACINPTSMVVEFPVHIYGNFCNPETSFIKEQYIPYLASQCEIASRQSSQIKVVLIHALGKLGHYKAITPLVKIIGGQMTEKPLIRSLAVYALKRVAVQYPAKVRPILLSLIDNPAENPEVRIAAVSVLPFSSPSSAELQKVAVRTWFEPSKQVASFIYSTFSSLKSTQVPELISIRSKVKNILPMVRPVQSGIQFSHNIHSSKFLEYLKIVSENGVKLVNTEHGLLPNKISYNFDLISRSFRIQGMSFTLYTQGMDYILEKLISMSGWQGESSQAVRSELEKIGEKLQIKQREIMEPEAHLRLRVLGLERIFSLNTEFYMQTVEKIREQIRSSPDIFTNGMHFKYTKAEKLSDIQVTGPSDSGFPIFVENTIPMIYSVKGMFKAKNSNEPETESSIPNSITTQIMPVVNVKIQSNQGVISPFTKQFIGCGVSLGVHSATPIETKFSLNKEGQVSISIRTPEQIKKEIELLHISVKPYTFKKSLQNISPASQAAGNRKVLSGQELKTFEANPTKYSVGIDAPIKVSTDYPVFNLGTIVEKIRQTPNPLSAIQTLIMPTSVRYFSLKIRYNPTSSETKELQARFTIAQGIKESSASHVKVSFPKVLSHSEEIKKMCVENHQNDFEVTECLKEQERSILSTVDVSEHDRHFCQNEVRQETSSRASRSQMTQELESCLKSAKVCEEAKVVCMKKNHRMSESSKKCEEKKRACHMRQLNLLKIKSTLRRLERGCAASLAFEGSVNTHYEKKTVSAIISAGAKKTGLHVKSYFEVDVKTPTISEAAILQGEIDTHLPEIKSKWNVDQMINDDLSYKSDIIMHYGYKSTPRSQMKKIVLNTQLIKTVSQKKAIKTSTEYSRCQRETMEGRTLTPICEKVRHQASSVDMLNVKIIAPHDLKNCPVAAFFRSTMEAAFWPHITERVYDSSSASSLSPNEATFVALISRQGNEAQIKYRHPGFEWDIDNIRLSSAFKNVLPLSMRNSVSYRLLQKTTSQQTPASCRIEDQYVSTFDNRTYQFTLNDCEHLLVKDCSGVVPLAVTARGSASMKMVKIAAGQTVIELKPIQGSVNNGIFVNGDNIKIRPGQVYSHRLHSSISSGSSSASINGYNPVTMEIKSFLDGVVVVREFISNVEVSFDGRRIEVVAPQLMRSRACGICGDMNGETTADLRTPKMCVFEKSRISAYSYMIKESCQGVPSQDKAEYEKEVRQCIKKTTMKTPLEDLTRRLIKVKSGPSGVISKHIIEYRANGNEMCISKKVISICEGSSVPVIGHMSSTAFTCLQSHTSTAKHLKSLVMANEEIPQLTMYPTTYNRMIEEAASCRLPSSQTHTSSSSSGSSSGSSSSSSGSGSSDYSSLSSGSPRPYKPRNGRFQPQIYDY